jgi:multiple sugar transport system substrate-binding protein
MPRPTRTLLLLALCLLLAACSASRQLLSGSPAPFRWRQFEGTTLRVVLSQNRWLQVAAPYFPEFEELTGIRLQIEDYPQDELWNLLETALDEPGRVDVFTTVPALDGIRLVRAGRVAPVNAFLQDPSLTAPEFLWEDFLPRLRAAVEIEGAILGPPIMAEHLALIYRKDVFKQYQVEVPRTLEELEATARLLHKKPMGSSGAPGVAIVGRGKSPANTSLFAGILYASGGSWFDDRGRPGINGPTGREALEYLSRLAGKYAPPNLAELDWEEASAVFMAGGAAMYIEGSSVVPLLEKSEKSKVAGKVGYALFPAGRNGSGATVAAVGLAVAKRSANPKAAWLFLQWAAGKEMVRRALANEILVGRQSLWRDRWARTEIPPDLARSFQEAARVGHPQWAPPMVAVTSAREAVGAAVTAALKGEDVRAAADAAARRLEEILAATERPPSGASQTP